MVQKKKEPSAVKQKTNKQTWCSITRRIDNKSAKFFSTCSLQGGEARGLQLDVHERVRVLDPAARSLHTISSLSRRHTGACDQPLQNLQRIHYHVSGCSASRDHVPILYDILYWGGGGGGAVRSFTEAEVRGRAARRGPDPPPPGRMTRFPVASVLRAWSESAF